MEGSTNLWKVVITSYHLLPAHQRGKTGQKADFAPLVLQSNPGLWLYTLSKRRYVWKYLCFFGGPDILCLGPPMLVSACQYNSLVDPAMNEQKSRSESKKEMTTRPEEDDQGTEYLPCPWKSSVFSQQEAILSGWK